MWPLPATQQAKLCLWTRKSDRGTTLECYFCRACGVRLLHLPLRTDGTPGPTVTVKAGCVEGLSLTGARHIWAKSAVLPVPEDADMEEPTEETEGV